MTIQDQQDRHIRLARGMGHREISWLEGCTMMRVPPNSYWMGIEGDVRLSAPDAERGFIVFNPDACPCCRERLLFYCLHRHWWIQYGRGEDGEYTCRIVAAKGTHEVTERTPMRAFLAVIDLALVIENSVCDCCHQSPCQCPPDWDAADASGSRDGGGPL